MQERGKKRVKKPMLDEERFTTQQVGTHSSGPEDKQGSAKLFIPGFDDVSGSTSSTIPVPTILHKEKHIILSIDIGEQHLAFCCCSEDNEAGTLEIYDWRVLKICESKSLSLQANLPKTQLLLERDKLHLFIHRLRKLFLGLEYAPSTVVIEQQAPTLPTMHTISVFLLGFCGAAFPQATLELFPTALKAETVSFLNPKSVEAGSDYTKKLAIETAQLCLGASTFGGKSQALGWLSKLEKRDDAADCLLQALYYLRRTRWEKPQSQMQMALSKNRKAAKAIREMVEAAEPRVSTKPDSGSNSNQTKGKNRKRVRAQEEEGESPKLQAKKPKPKKAKKNKKEIPLFFFQRSEDSSIEPQ